MKCANFHCENDLTEWELKRRHFKFSTHDLCRKCRNIRVNIIRRCRECNHGFDGIGEQTYCDGCKRERKNRYAREKSRAIDKEIRKKQNSLYFINHKETINAKRRSYKRQKWSERADNPKRINNVEVSKE